MEEFRIRSVMVNGTLWQRAPRRLTSSSIRCDAAQGVSLDEKRRVTLRRADPMLFSRSAPICLGRSVSDHGLSGGWGRHNPTRALHRVGGSTHQPRSWANGVRPRRFLLAARILAVVAAGSSFIFVCIEMRSMNTRAVQTGRPCGVVVS